MNLLIRLALSLMLVTTVGLLSGCGDTSQDSGDTSGKSTGMSDEHGHDHDHDVPETYADAVKEIKEMREAVAKAEEGGDLNAAHDPLHEVGHVLEEVVPLAKKASIGDAEMEAIKKAVDELYDGFGAVDAKLHNDEKNAKTFAEVKDSIDNAIATLESNVKSDGDASDTDN